jgi:protein-L-isoaspartate O-methyltransferase
LREQLAENGRLIIPVGGIGEQLLLLMTKREGGFSAEKFGGVRFVPLVGEHAWKN